MTFSFLQLQNYSIYEQLCLEEALLRTSQDNWCLINTGVPPAIVMGISGKPEKLIHASRVKQDAIPVIKRFSGGGTVYVDDKTVFVTFICNTSDLKIPAQPKSILQWSHDLYQPFFPGFCLCENDYVLGERKFAGNAQYIQKNRWLLHTSFLWDYDPSKMHYLLMPEIQPAYRAMRSHEDFLCRLNSIFPDKNAFIQQLIAHLSLRFHFQHCSLATLSPLLASKYRQSTSFVDLP